MNLNQGNLIKKKNTLDWKNLCYTLQIKKKNKDILKNLNGKIQSGNILGIIGPSGSGKSTFLDLLANRKDKKKMKGDIFFNSKKISEIKYISSYVKQKEVLLTNLTVYENIKYSAELNISKKTIEKENKKISYIKEQFTKNSKNLKKSEQNKINKRIVQIIKDFGLEKIKNSKIGNIINRGISGGEKRRTYIATQIISYKNIIFLDEPTSGLDSASSYYIIKAIKEIAKKNNLIIILTIHQPCPNVFNFLDKIMVLGNGRNLFFGHRIKLKDYFKSLGYFKPMYESVTDYVLDLININFGDRYVKEKRIEEFGRQWEKYEIENLVNDIETNNSKIDLIKNIDKKDIKNFENEENTNVFRSFDKKNYTNPQNSFIQTLILLRRSLKNNLRNIINYWAKLIIFTIMFIAIATVYLNLNLSQHKIEERLGLFAFSLTFPCFMQVSCIPLFFEEKILFIREYKNGSYGVLPFIISSTLISIPFLFLIVIFNSLLLYFIIPHFYIFENFAVYVIIYFLLLLISESMAILLIFVFDTMVTSIGIYCVLHAFLMMNNSHSVKKFNMKSFWYGISFVNFYKYGYEAIVYSNFKDLSFECDLEISGDCSCFYQREDMLKCQMSGQDVLKNFWIEDINLGLWICILCCMIVFLKLWLCFYLKFSKKYNN